MFIPDPVLPPIPDQYPVPGVKKAPDPDPHNWKIAIYLSLRLHKGRPSYRTNLQTSTRNIQHFKTWKFITFFLLSHFALLDPDSDSGSTDLVESGSWTMNHKHNIYNSARKARNLYGRCLVLSIFKFQAAFIEVTKKGSGIRYWCGTLLN